jgi:hypothetical protein
MLNSRRGRQGRESGPKICFTLPLPVHRQGKGEGIFNFPVWLSDPDPELRWAGY